MKVKITMSSFPLWRERMVSLLWVLIGLFNIMWPMLGRRRPIPRCWVSILRWRESHILW